jgi:PKD repeat protein
LTVIYSPDPITTAAINRYQWDLDGNGTFEISDTVGRNFSYRYATPGDYAVSLRVTDSKGRQDTQTKTIVITNAPPVVSAQGQPSNGQVPLTVSFSVTASDNEGIGRYEWDFQGDGAFDYTSTTTGNTSYTYTAVGTYLPVLRVTDTRGTATIYAVPATEVRAAPTGTPTVTASASPASGNAPLNVTHSGSASDPQGRPFVKWEWDFQNDGVYDRSATTATQVFTYSAAGTYFPRLRVTTDDGRTAEDVAQVVVNPTFALSLSMDTIDPALSEATTVTTTLGAETEVSLVIETRAGSPVRTLVPFTVRAAGTYSDVWDGRDDDGAIVTEGQYRAVLVYELSGVTKRFDLGLTTGGSQYNPPRTTIPSTFSPLAGQPLTIDFTLSRASEVTAFVGRYSVDTRLVTFLDRQPLGKGTHRIIWNGDDGDGVLIHPPPGDWFLFGIFGYTFPNNGIFVRSGVRITGLSAEPSIFDPSALDDAGSPSSSAVHFTLSKPATVELMITDATTGAVLGRIQYPNLQAGSNTIVWDGKDNDGVLVAPGRYRLGVTAIEPNGFKSLTSYTLQRIFY